MYANREGSGEIEASLSFHWSPICKVPKLCASPFIAVFNLGNFSGDHFHLISDKNKILSNISPFKKF